MVGVGWGGEVGGGAGVVLWGCAVCWWGNGFLGGQRGINSSLVASPSAIYKY